MSEYAYAGTVPRSYPETRDAEGVIVGTVSYGDRREFDREWVAPKPAEGEQPEAAPPGWPAPDRDWFPADEPLPQRVALKPEPAAGPDAAGTSGSTPPGTPPAGQPATGTTPPSPPPGGAPAATSPATTTAPAGDGQKAG